MGRRIRKILVANRGEIALRIIRTCQEMGIRTLAVYSEVDRTSRHVRAADEAYFLGPSPPKESYLCIPKILEVARVSHCDAIHPGYGFLSENLKFGRLAERRGFIFIGPTPKNMETLGDKLKARRLMRDAGVPVIPGSHAPIQLATEALSLAKDIVYPILSKAAAGGGARGMRIVVRVESSVEEETEISYHYDPLISKLICWGETRSQAILRMDRALREYSISGVQTTIPFCVFVVNHLEFRRGHYDKGFVRT